MRQPSSRSFLSALRPAAESFTSSDSVISTSISEAGTPAAAASARMTRAGSPCSRSLPDTLMINVSGKDLLHGDPARVIRAEAAAAGVPASLIEVEITESLLVKDSAAGRNALKKLRELGCRIALDDFGTGYS